jgi:ethanolamine ammonia-lyase large subunit
MQKLLKKYENVQFTYYIPSEDEVQFHITSRLKHITNGYYNKYMSNPLGESRTKDNKKMITIDCQVVDESYTKVESDIKMLNYIIEHQETKKFTQANFSHSVPMAVKRLKEAGIDVTEYNHKVKSAEECVFDLK